jgi:hypothetical protein
MLRRRRVHDLIISLCIADLMVGFVTIPINILIRTGIFDSNINICQLALSAAQGNYFATFWPSSLPRMGLKNFDRFFKKTKYIRFINFYCLRCWDVPSYFKTFNFSKLCTNFTDLLFKDLKRFILVPHFSSMFGLVSISIEMNGFTILI